MLIIVLGGMLVGRLPPDVGDEEVDKEELREKSKVISKGVLLVEFGNIEVDFVEIDDALELGCVVEANIDVEIPLEVEEYVF